MPRAKVGADACSSYLPRWPQRSVFNQLVDSPILMSPRMRYIYRLMHDPNEGRKGSALLSLLQSPVIRDGTCACVHCAHLCILCTCAGVSVKCCMPCHVLVSVLVLLALCFNVLHQSTQPASCGLQLVGVCVWQCIVMFTVSHRWPGSLPPCLSPLSRFSALSDVCLCLCLCVCACVYVCGVLAWGRGVQDWCERFRSSDRQRAGRRAATARAETRMPLLCHARAQTHRRSALARNSSMQGGRMPVPLLTVGMM